VIRFFLYLLNADIKPRWSFLSSAWEVSTYTVCTLKAAHSLQRTYMAGASLGADPYVRMGGHHAPTGSQLVRAWVGEHRLASKDSTNEA
jgi:hypothetical protein